MGPHRLVSDIARKALEPLGIIPRGGKPPTPSRPYRPRDPLKSLLRHVTEREIERVYDLWDRFEGLLGPWKIRYQQTAERFLACGILSKGFSMFRCQDCGHTLKVAFSCKTRLCPSCVRKRMTQWSEWLGADVLLDIPHRHWVFTIPRELRRHFVEKRWLLNKLSSNASRILMRQMAVRCPEAYCMGGVIAVVQTAGDGLSFNPHVHIIATTYCLGPSGRLHRVPYIPYVKLSRIWKTSVLSLLKNMKCLTQAETDAIWARYLKGFNLNGEIKDTTKDREASRRLAEYLLRPPMAESRMIGYDKKEGKVYFHARGAKNWKTGRRARIVGRMDSAEFVARLLAQTPPKGQKLVNYYGLYSNKVRGMWKKAGYKMLKLLKRQRRERVGSGWRSQLWRVFEVDPLICPRCGVELTLMELVFPAVSSLLAQPP